ncbi:type II toxin-antitoxin system PemK/MazF family toxin [Candidatus Woesearchaeota archaeon]|nr:type II toxin-antitoxin system PemK/MazF family toxin [Candidatus Woesearchaeota archaeon]
MEQVSINQRDLFLVPFPFSNLKGSKVRPVLILSKNDFNLRSEDVLVCSLTSNTIEGRYKLNITNNDLENGELYNKCAIKIENIAKINKGLLLKNIGKIKETTFSKVLNNLIKIFQ